jgi:hypothetical protein
MPKLFPDDPGLYVEAARRLAGCALLAEQDSKLPPAKRSELAEAYDARAVELLRQALAHGYRDTAGLGSDADLRRLTQRADFQKLLGPNPSGR